MVKKTAVLGHPVSHSLSPRLHGYWLKQYAIKGSYEAKDVLPEALGDVLTSLSADGYRGVNLTVPHKETALSWINKIDDTAARIGAVNTVVVCQDGTLSATNTDAYGFIENLRAQVGELSPFFKKTVILGAGGAARAACVALMDAGAEEIILINRSRDKAEKIKTDLGGNIQTGDWEKRDSLLFGAGLLVNATSLGMKKMPPLELSLENLPQAALVTDIVYNPLTTPLLRQAQVRGNKVVDGIGMLLYQAQKAFELWHGILPEVDDALRCHMLEGL